MNKLYCQSCGFETADKREIKDYCVACGSTMIVIVPATYRPFSDIPENRNVGSQRQREGDDEADG